jgi:protein-S-isoprenylcysteine O-methyltransferase
MLLLWITIAASMTLCGFTQYYLHDWHPFPRMLHHAATIILLAGLIIRLVSVLSLGKAFSANVAIRESQALNQSGIYKFIRHPSYLGLIIIFLAVGLHSANPAGLLIAFVPTTAMLLYRIHIEEAALLTAFGPQYRTYMANTKRLVPWVY